MESTLGNAIITVHAIERYMQRIRPGADFREGREVLREAATRAVKTDERTWLGHLVWVVKNPDLRFITKHDRISDRPVCVTVLAPEEKYESAADVRKAEFLSRKTKRDSAKSPVQEADEARQRQGHIDYLAKCARHEQLLAERDLLHRKPAEQAKYEFEKEEYFTAKSRRLAGWLNYTDPDGARLLRRFFDKLAAFVYIARGPLDDSQREMFYRAGNCKCGLCKRSYSAHVHDPFEPWLTILCNNERVKL